jgi:hypothetical protein
MKGHILTVNSVKRKQMTSARNVIRTYLKELNRLRSQRKRKEMV